MQTVVVNLTSDYYDAVVNYFLILVISISLVQTSSLHEMRQLNRMPINLTFGVIFTSNFEVITYI